MTTVLRYHQVSVTVTDGRTPRDVLRDVTVDVHAGELVAVMGPAAPASRPWSTWPAAWSVPPPA